MEISEFTLQHAKQVCDWEYPAPYNIYNNPKWEVAVSKQLGVTKQDIRRRQFYAVLDNGNLLGYFRLSQRDNSVFIGIGVKPEICSKGIGLWSIQNAINICKERFCGYDIKLEVRAFNQRAINCYKKAGFQIIDTYIKTTPLGEGEFYLMKYIV